MKITCNACHSRFKIPDDSVPPGKKASMLCPKCKKKITVYGEGGSKQAFDEKKEILTFDDFAPTSEGMDTYESEDRPFDFVEEEGKTALLCEKDRSFLNTIQEPLRLLEYHTSMANDARDALKKMRYHTFDLIVVNETFDTQNPDANGVLIYLERLNMMIRRNIFVIMISNRFRTMDNMMAFRNSVNLIINSKNIAEFGTILSRGVTDNEFFYRLFKENLREAGQV
jgi:predicted Zn finger-like uncharacterized protein